MKRKLLFLFLFAITVPIVHAITIDECQEAARNNFPLIKQYGLLEEKSGLDISNIKKSWIPQIVLNAQASYQSDVTAFPDGIKQLLSQVSNIEGLSKDQYKIALELNQTIWDGGISKSSKKIAQKQQAVSEQNIEVELYKIRSIVNDLYFGILLIDETIKQNHTQILLLDKNHDKILSHLRNGTATQSDADAVYAQLLTVKQQNKQLESTKKEYCDALAILTGLNAESLILEMPAIQTTDNYENNRPELKYYDAQLSLLDTQKKSLDANITPRFNLFATGFYGNPGLNMFEDMVNPGWSWNYIIGIGMRWNIGKLYTRKNDLQSIRTQKKIIENTRDVFLFNTDIKTSQKRNEIERNRDLTTDDDEIIAYRTKIREAAESKLENGIIDTTDLLQKITDENTARITRSIHKIELLKSQYELKNILNN